MLRLANVINCPCSRCHHFHMTAEVMCCACEVCLACFTNFTSKAPHLSSTNQQYLQPKATHFRLSAQDCNVLVRRAADFSSPDHGTTTRHSPTIHMARSQSRPSAPVAIISSQLCSLQIGTRAAEARQRWKHDSEVPVARPSSRAQARDSQLRTWHMIEVYKHATDEEFAD